MKQRYKDFLDAFIAGGLVEDEEHLLAAGARAWSGLKRYGSQTTEASERRIVRKARKVLHLTASAEYIADYYDVAAGFTVAEAARLHVKHIRGEFADSDGKPIPPSYPALRDYNKAVQPQEPKRIDQRTIVQRVGPPRVVGTPTMTPRAIGTNDDS